MSFVLFFFIVSVCVVAWAQIFVCPECGREVEGDARQCGHCQAILPAQSDSKADVVANAAGEGPEADIQRSHRFLESGKLEFLGLDTLREEVKAGREHLAAGRVELAALFFRNALALAPLTGPHAEGEKITQEARDLLARAQAYRHPEREVCPVCEGTREVEMISVDMKGQTRKKKVARATCPRCGMSGFLIKPATVARKQEAVGKAAEQYATLQIARDFYAVGSLWLPAELRDRIPLRALTAALRARAEPCPACAGGKEMDCRVCRGLGEIKCDTCQMGQIPVVVKGMGKGKLVRNDTCPQCQGRGGLACSACKGHGRQTCSLCKGTGERALCRHCKGSGSLVCSACKGAERGDHGPCAHCAGEGLALCGKCSGDGRERTLHAH